MKKLFFLLAMCLLMAACSSHLDEPQMAELPQTDGQSDYLTPTEACEIASDAFDNFFKGTADATPSSRSARSAYAHFYQSDALSRSQSPSLYVVDFEEGGFAVVNAHRETNVPVFAVVENGSFDETGNAGLKHYMMFASERAKGNRPASRLSGPIGGTGNNDPYIIRGDKLINTKEIKTYVMTNWSRYAPYNGLCNFMPNTTERYPLGTFATVLGSIVSFHKDTKFYLDVEPIMKDKYYSFDWFEMLEGPTYDDLSTVGKKNLLEFLTLLNNFDSRFLENGELTDYTMPEASLDDLIGETYWFSTPTVYNRYVSPEEIYDNINVNGPQMMYGEEYEDPIGDVWMLQGVKYNTYRMDNPNMQDPITGEQLPGEGPEYTISYLYMNWCLGGRANGWFFYNGVWHDYSNNIYDAPDYDPDAPTGNYTYNIHPILDIRYKKTE